jgi:hypothetical protein
MANPRAPQALVGDALGYAPEELANLESELSSLTLGDLVGNLTRAREELCELFAPSH